MRGPGPARWPGTCPVRRHARLPDFRAVTAIIRTLIADDDPDDRERALAIVQEIPGLEVTAVVGTGAEAVEAIRAHHPDLVLLDVRMPTLSGLDVVREIGPDRMPATIFVTADEQFAAQAFAVAAVDYVVKPYDDQRLHQAIQRALRLIELQELHALRQRMLALLGVPPTTEAVAAPRYLDRIAVEMTGKVRVVLVEEIDYITASGPYAELHVGDRALLIRERMHRLESRLDPERFVRIHRSVIVALDRIESLVRQTGGDWEVQLRTGARLRVSRARRGALELRLGVTPAAE
jgi:two-component system, LytTR family, response regulator